MPNIHPTAIVHPDARLADTVEVGPFCLVGPHVQIDSGSKLYSHVVIEGHTTIGKNNRIFHHVTLGQEPQDLKFRGEPATLVIGDSNDIREHVTMHIGTENGGGVTSVGSKNMLMVGCHIAHDCHIGSHCLLANNAMLAGHIRINDHAVLAGGVAVAHYVTIGRYAFIAGNSGVEHDCPPFMVALGFRAHVRGVNQIGLTRHGFTPQSIDNLKFAYRKLFLKEGAATQAAALEDLENRFATDPVVRELTAFLRNAASAVNGRYLETLRRDDKRLGPVR